MKAIKFFFVCGLFFVLPAFSQIFNERNLLNIKNREQLQTSKTILYEGFPFVKIEPTIGSVPHPNFTQWMDEERYRLFGSTQITDKSLKAMNKAEQIKTNFQNIQSTVIPEYQIRTPFGKETTAAFINHTTDFTTIIQLINDSTILVEERIQFITTKNLSWERILSKDVSNIPQSKPLEINLISVKKDNHTVSFTTEETSDKLIIRNPNQIEPGVHFFTLKYLVKNAILPFGGATRLAISLTGTEWPLPIDRFTLITLQPQKTSIFAKEILFGSNNIPILNSFDAKTDTTGNTFYTLTHPLPAFADVKVIEMFDGTKLLKASFKERLNNLLPNLTLILNFLITIFYLCVSSSYIKWKKPEKDFLKKINKLPFFTLLFIKKKPLTYSFLKEMEFFWKYKQKRNHILSLSIVLSHYIGTAFILKKTLNLYSFLLLSSKYLFTELFLLLLTFLISYIEEIKISPHAWLFLGICIFILHILFFKFSLLPTIKKEINIFIQKLLTPSICFGLTQQEILALYIQYYQTTRSLDIHVKWVSIIKKFYPQLKLPFIKGI